MIKSSDYKYLVAALIILTALAVSFTIVVHAETNASGTPEGNKPNITFPVQELGGCSSKEECKTYCNDPSHIEACIAFAKAHGLMNKTEADQAAKFQKVLSEKGGPGGCTSPEECKSYCSQPANLETCVNFASQNGIRTPQAESGKKILAYLKSGGKMPGDCTSEASCKEYCSDFSHAEECQTFAQSAGLAPSTPNLRQGSSTNPMKKFASLLESGQTPGGCTTKEGCESYCQESSHHEECVAFAIKAGLITQDQADQKEKQGFEGPGGCNSKESCKSYCDDDSRKEECLAFAKEHGLIKQNEIQRFGGQNTSGSPGFPNGNGFQSGSGTRPGVPQSSIEAFKKLLQSAPSDVISCIKEKLGADFDSLQSGTNISIDTSKLKPCFENYRPQVSGQSSSTYPSKPQGGNGGGPTQFLNSLPPQVLACLKYKLGDKFSYIESGMTKELSGMGQEIQTCFNQSGSSTQMNGKPPQGEMDGQSGHFPPPGGTGGQPGGSQGGFNQMPGGSGERMPPGMPPQGGPGEGPQSSVTATSVLANIWGALRALIRFPWH